MFPQIKITVYIKLSTEQSEVSAIPTGCYEMEIVCISQVAYFIPPSFSIVLINIASLKFWSRNLWQQILKN